MRLELHKVKVRDVQWGDKTYVENGTLYVDKQEAIAVVAEEGRFAKVDLELARPGESVRIIPVKDAVEPRVKLDGKGYFPGFCAPMDRCGEGRTLVLDGVAVVTCGPIVAFQEGFVDMSGPGALYTPFSETLNVVLNVEPVEDLEKHQYETILREAGLKLAVHLAECCKDAKADVIDVFEKGTVAEENKKYPSLPKIIYVCMNITQGLLHDTYVYGADIRPSLPTLLHPNEVLDGGMVSGNCVSACDKNTTWHHVHNPIVAALYKRHGKELNFLGVIPTQESTVLAGKLRASKMNLTIAQELGADGVIVSEEGYGNPDTDLCLNAKNFELAGIKSVVVSDEASGTDGASQSLADVTPEMTGFVSTGNVNEMLEVPAMEKVLGWPESIAHLSGGAAESLREDGSMFVEMQAITASTAEIGYNRVGCEWV
ncbi:MAG: glycine/sarcosine/betaine reductase component B subunit [Synergistaceae bacterium]|nr:glycine/sarcosine/betaine reductase component B subunit [Synergistaceae bacterium]